MTKFEKMAKEHADSEHGPDMFDSRAMKQCQADYIAGLRAARKMAVKRFELAFERAEVVQDTLDAIALLGEEE